MIRIYSQTLFICALGGFAWFALIILAGILSR